MITRRPEVRDNPVDDRARHICRLDRPAAVVS